MPASEDTVDMADKSHLDKSKLLTLWLATRPKFLVASAAPVIVGSALAYADVGLFLPGMFVLALLAIMSLHTGANVANDYFDHISGNDWANRNPTPFSGGRRFIQKGLLSAKATLLLALVALAVGSALGVIIVIITRSLFILLLGLIGMLGGFFYTAPPAKLGYHSTGELVIALLCGILPVSGAYYLQTATVNPIVLVPGSLVGILIFLVILINEFPDLAADAAANKRTLVVWLGVTASIWIYRVALMVSYLLAALSMLFWPIMFFAGLFYLCTIPIAIAALKSAVPEQLTTPGRYRANQITILLHAAGSFALTAGFLIHRLH
jgi:1,4-dihydroxy-2-naphthoate octaprenyltransferase